MYTNLEKVNIFNRNYAYINLTHFKNMLKNSRINYNCYEKEVYKFSLDMYHEYIKM